MAKSNCKVKAIIYGVCDRKFSELIEQGKFRTESWYFANRMMRWIDSNTTGTMPILGKPVSLTNNQLNK